jgi:hypothetical protein
MKVRRPKRPARELAQDRDRAALGQQVQRPVPQMISLAHRVAPTALQKEPRHPKF